MVWFESTRQHVTTLPMNLTQTSVFSLLTHTAIKVYHHQQLSTIISQAAHCFCLLFIWSELVVSWLADYHPRLPFKVLHLTSLIRGVSRGAQLMISLPGSQSINRKLFVQRKTFTFRIFQFPTHYIWIARIHQIKKNSLISEKKFSINGKKNVNKRKSKIGEK